MFKDDDEEEDNTFGVTRYPCMPSLVALQQMRNRHHLANLGRKLMKWTALATGTELRNIAGRLDKVYQSFSEDMRDAYIALARGRYFYPNLNKMVVEGCPSVAEVVLATSTRTASGVKIIKYDIIENNTHPYEHLGIEKGGQTILDAKRAWLDLLRRIILMVELRTNFRLVESMHKAANKKMNVLAKVVIPKTKATCAYIISALEELARDEFYRRKMILEVKERQKQKNNVEEKGISCEHLTLESNVDMDKNSIITSLKENVSAILEIVNKLDGKAIEKSDINEILNIGEELQSKLDSSLKSETPLTIPSFYHYSSTKNSLESVSNKSAQTSKKEIKSSEKTLPLENYVKPHVLSEFIETNSNIGEFEIVVKEITKIIRIKNKDGTIREEKKIVKIRKEVKNKGPQNSISICTSNYSLSSKDGTNCDTSECCVSELSSNSSHSRIITIQMMSVSDWMNRKLLNKCLHDQKYWPKQNYGESSKSKPRIYYDKSLLNRDILPNLDTEDLRYRDYSSNSICEDDEDVGTNTQDSCIPNFECKKEIVEKHDLNSKIPFTEQKIIFFKTKNRCQCQQKSNETIHTDL